MQIMRIEDPRDELEKANRDELFRFAQSVGVAEIDERMFMGANAAIMMRKVLRQRGITNIRIPARQLGMPYGAISPEPSGKSMTADEMAEMDYAAQRKASETENKPSVDIAQMTIGALRRTCKERGVKFDRTDKMTMLREKLSGQTAP